MNSIHRSKATPANEPAAIESPRSRPRRSVDHENSALYGRGRRIADGIARSVALGEDHRVALRRVADDSGLDVAEARSAVRFKEAADRIAGNVGQDAKSQIL